MKKTTLLLLLLCLALLAQDVPQQLVPQQSPPPPPTPVFAYEGKPIALPYQCSLEDIRWSGLTCSEDEPCPIYLELSSVEAVGEVTHEDIKGLNKVLIRLERFWSDQIRFRL